MINNNNIVNDNITKNIDNYESYNNIINQSEDNPE